MLKLNTKLFKILRVQSNSYSSRWKKKMDFVSLFQNRKYSCISAKTKASAGHQTTTFRHVRSISHTCLNNVRYRWKQKPFSQATAPHQSRPKLLLTPSWPGAIAQSLVHIFFNLLSLYLLPNLYWQWSQPSHSFLFWEEQGVYFFVNHFYIHNIHSPRG